MGIEVIEGELSLCAHTVGITIGGGMGAFWCGQCGALCTQVERYAEEIVQGLKAAGVSVSMKAGYVQQASTGRMVQLFAVSPAPRKKSDDLKLCVYCGGTGYITQHDGDMATRCTTCGGRGKVKAD